MKYVCIECGHLFDEPKRYVETHCLDCGPYENFLGCPHCGEAYVEAHKCDCCGEYITSSYVMTDDDKRYCQDCYFVRDLADDF